MYLYIVSVIITMLLALWILIYFAFQIPHYVLKSKHILITGGSSGIGLSVGIEAVKRGAACVTIVARNTAQLEAGCEHIKKFSSNKQIIQYFSADVTSPNISIIQDMVAKAEVSGGPIDVLVNCAGTSLSRSFVQTSAHDFKKLMDVNYFGSVHVCKCIIPRMIKRQTGRVVLTSSVAGHMGLYGYSAYSASKFALRGLAECLQMEMQPYNVKVSLIFPPDTDTPGYTLEQLEKSEETQLISEYGGLFQAEDVSRHILDSVESGQFLVPIGFDGWVMSSTSCGLTAAPSLQVIAQVLLSGVFRLVSLFYLHKFNGIVKMCSAKRQQQSSLKKK